MINWNRLAVRDGLLVRKWFREDRLGFSWQVVVPASMVKHVLTQVHVGVDKTMERVLLYSPGYRTDVRHYVNTCFHCHARNDPTTAVRAPLQLQKVSKRWQKVAIDSMGPLPTIENGNRYTLVIIDCFTKYAEACLLPNQEAKTVTVNTMDQFICRYGVPESIHTDKGRLFESEMFQMLCREQGVQKTRTTPYHPSDNGQVKRMNRILANVLTKVVQEEGRHWDECLPKVMMAYRASAQSSIHETAYAMVFRAPCRMPQDVYGTGEQPINSVWKHIRQLKAALTKVHPNARRHLREAAVRQKQNHDQNYAGGLAQD
uniref:RNA-directed DNA polymerase n=1 Tax=Trichuris muris TaxID=70415 RepID=A0A5S6QFZ7_TRIMR